ncbi:MAG: hypothetical protein P4L84_01570 [Isosphaeraceae bacterium]|nr:hypothetical protein [Isosphaeraceae bacterium]
MTREDGSTPNDGGERVPGENPFAIRYQLATRDFDRLWKKNWVTREYALGSPSMGYSGQRYACLIVGGLAAIQCFFFVWGLVESHGIGIIPLLIAAGVGVTWGTLRWLRWLSFRSWRAAGFFVTRAIALTCEGINIIEQPLGERRLSWADVTSVGIDEDYVVLVLNPRPLVEWPALSVFFIPRSAFSGPHAAERFAWHAESLRTAVTGAGDTTVPEQAGEAMPFGQTLAVTYQYGNDDLDRLIERKWRRRHLRGALRAFVLLEVGLLSFVLASQGPEVRVFVPIFGTILVAQYWLILWWVRRIVRGMWGKAGIFETRTLELSPVRIAVHSGPHREWRVAWEAVRRTCLETQDVVLDIPSRWVPLVVPGSAFASPDAAGAFVQAAERWRIDRRDAVDRADRG